MRHFDADQTRRLLPMPALIDAVAAAARDLADGRIACPERLVVPLRESGVLLSMPAVADDITVHKLISVMPDNAARGLPAIQGQLSVLDSATGATRLTLDGPTVTGRRTAAVSLLGLRLLQAAAPRHVLLIGAGTQALHHAAALAEVHPGLRVTLAARTPASAQRFLASRAADGLDLQIAQMRPAPPALGAADDGAGGPHPGWIIPPDVDVVISCTNSREPVYREPASSARLLIAVGAFQPQAAEIDAATVRQSVVVVDDPAGARHEAGDLLRAGIDWNDVVPLHALLRPPVDAGAGRQADAGASSSGRALLFKSVGCAAWDLAAARLALASAA